MSVTGATLASCAIYAVHPGLWHTSLPVFLRQNIILGVLITTVSSLSLFATSRMRDGLQHRARELEQQVQLGALQLEARAEDLVAAHEIQSHLLPREMPQAPRMQIAAAWQPAQEVGGDYFDVLELSGGRLGLCIADVAGKGMAAALLMANLQAAFRAFAPEAASPAELCRKLNRALTASIAPGRFVTLVYGTIDPETLHFQYGNAGHAPPILLRDGKASTLPGGGTVLGLFPEAPYEELLFQLAPGDCLLLSTDGVTEAASPPDLEVEFGDQRLAEVALAALPGGAPAVRTRILEAVTAFCEGSFRDDASLLVLLLLRSTI